MEPPVHRFTYFDIRGRGELSRLVFAAASVNYQEIQYHIELATFSMDEWNHDKKEHADRFPYGQLVKKPKKKNKLPLSSK